MNFLDFFSDIEFGIVSNIFEGQVGFGHLKTGVRR